MQLGVVMTGAGAHAAACAGVLEALAQRGMEPYAVCALGTSAFVGALYACGCGAQEYGAMLAQASRLGERMLRHPASSRALLRGKSAALLRAGPLERLLMAQTHERILALCARRVMFPVRRGNAQRMVFSTRGYESRTGALIAQQASVSFAARAAMAVPPYLAPVTWMGAPLFPDEDAAFGAQELLAMGAQRVLVINAAGAAGDAWQRLPQGTAVLSVPIPDTLPALALGRLCACAEWGKDAAERGLDAAFEKLGMASCRILSFRRSGLSHPQRGW